ncbi:Protein of unknown function [Chitinophaga sp. CF118]|uniref:DUF4199 domain-containing protein n=1 Tax=Chitinophaga sp. CF118 TaxID=1884367 RepID=UPI0008E6C2D1|nr:DUF4199 domain-containing protein [Chitinophaga sp. CF118]SFD49577.1 Protein of unknown function [Chitinophaga sp. CF118]
MSNASSLNPGIKWGVIAGVIAVLVNIIFWQSDRELFFSFVLGLVIAVVFVLFSVLAGLEMKRRLKGEIEFKQALKPVFLTFVIGGLFATGCTYVFYNYVDPTIYEQARKYALITTDRLAHSFGLPQDQIDEQMDGIKELDFYMGPGKAILTYFSLLIRYFVLAAIVAVCIRKKPTV